MKKLTMSQLAILFNMSLLDESDLTLEMPFNIARRPIAHMPLLGREHKEFVFIRGYAKAAFGLVQRGILMRDSDDPFFWLTTFGISYIKGLQS